MKCPCCRHRLPLSQMLKFKPYNIFACPSCGAFSMRKNYRNIFAITIPVIIFCVVVVIPEIRKHEVSFFSSTLLYAFLIAFVVLIDALTTKLRARDHQVDVKPARLNDD